MIFAVPPSYTFGNTSRTLPETRSPNRENYDVSLNKRVMVREGTSVNLRAEAYHLTKTLYFAGPGVSLGASNFGVISSSSGERQIQFALKVFFLPRTSWGRSFSYVMKLGC